MHRNLWWWSTADRWLVYAQKEHAEEHYSDLRSKPFFGGLVEFICSSPVVAMVWQGEISSQTVPLGARRLMK